MPKRESSRAQRPVLRAIEFMSLFLRRPRGDSLLGIRRQGRNGSSLPHDQRGSPVPVNLGLEPVQPELGVIVMHILRRCAFYAGMVSSRLTLLVIQGKALALRP